MEKYSESVKEAQEKLEQAEKKATDVCRQPLSCVGTGPWGGEQRKRGALYGKHWWGRVAGSVPAMLTPSQAVGARQVPCRCLRYGGTAQSQHPKTRGQAASPCIANTCGGKTPQWLLKCVRKVKKSRETGKALACDQLLSTGCIGCLEFVGGQSFWAPTCHPVPWEGKGQEEFYLGP